MTLEKSLIDCLEDNALRHSAKLALVTENRSLTCQELAMRVDSAARAIAMRFRGVQEQKVIATLLPNGWEFVVTYLGILKAGHILMPLDPTFKELEIGSIVSQIPPALIVTSQTFAASFPKDSRLTMAEEILTEQGSTDSPFLVLPADRQIATLLFTSGTTGKPKAVPYTHANHLWNIRAVSGLWEWTGDDTILTSLPLSHWHGLAMAISGSLYHGNTLYLQERFEAGATLREMASGRVSLFMHVPIAYHKLVQSGLENEYDISTVRLCISGSSHLPPSVWQGFKERFGQEILERYGSSETGLVTSNPLADRRTGSVGYPLDGVQVKIGDQGELLMRSPGLFPGYYNNPEATQAKYDEGWWHTGDIGEVDPDGRIHLKGRVQEKIKHFGYTLYPRDLEWAAMKHPKVKEAVVIGIQNEELSDQLVYFVVGSASGEELSAYFKHALPHSWRPDKVVLMDELPRTRSGKPRLAELKRIAQERV